MLFKSAYTISQNHILLRLSVVRVCAFVWLCVSPTLKYIQLGPGAYDQRSSIGVNAPSYTLSSRVVPKLENFSPGPGYSLISHSLSYLITALTCTSTLTLTYIPQ